MAVRTGQGLAPPVRCPELPPGGCRHGQGAPRPSWRASTAEFGKTTSRLMHSASATHTYPVKSSQSVSDSQAPNAVRSEGPEYCCARPTLPGGEAIHVYTDAGLPAAGLPPTSSRRRLRVLIPSRCMSTRCLSASTTQEIHGADSRTATARDGCDHGLVLRSESPAIDAPDVVSGIGSLPFHVTWLDVSPSARLKASMTTFPEGSHSSTSLIVALIDAS